MAKINRQITIAQRKEEMLATASVEQLTYQSFWERSHIFIQLSFGRFCGDSRGTCQIESIITCIYMFLEIKKGPKYQFIETTVYLGRLTGTCFRRIWWAVGIDIVLVSNIAKPMSLIWGQHHRNSEGVHGCVSCYNKTQNEYR